MTMANNPVSPWMLVNGSAILGSVELEDQALAPFEGNTPPSGGANITHHFAINQTDILTWVINEERFSEPARPIIYGSASDGWDAATTLHTPPNATVDLIIKVANESMDKVSSHIYSIRQHSIPPIDKILSRWAIRCIYTVTNSGSLGQARAIFHSSLLLTHLRR